MSVIATGVFKQLAFKRQSALGVIAPASGPVGALMRRVKSTVDLAKSSFKSAEILISQQRRDFRHGIRSVVGTISGELSNGGYQPFMESIVRQVVQTPATTGAIITVAAASTGAGVGTYTRSAGSFITDGFKGGDVVSCTGWTTTGVPNNNHYAVINALSATIMTIAFIDNVNIGAKVAGDSVTIAVVGKKTWTPAVSQSRDYYTIEHWFSDISQSEVFTDCVVSEMQVKMPATGIVTVDFPIMGLNIVEAGAQYFTTPSAAPSGAIYAGVNGMILVGSPATEVAIITSADITVKGNYSPVGGVVGSVADPDIYPGVIDVTGTLSILFKDTTYVDLFLNESTFTVQLILTGSNVAAPSFTSFYMAKCKAGGQTKDDGEKGITLTFPFTAIEQSGGAGAAFDDATIVIQDSTFA